MRKITLRGDWENARLLCFCFVAMVGYYSTAMKFDATELSIRTRLIDHLKTIEDNDAVFISEMFIEDFSRRADLIVANGRLAAYEIKSAADNVSRLAGQLETYVSLFENVTIVCAQNHIRSVLTIAPPSVGVWVITPSGEFNPHRNAKINRTRKDDWLTFLPVDMLRRLLREHDHPCSGVRTQLLSQASSIKAVEIREFVLRYLKEDRVERIESRRLKSERLAEGRLTQVQQDLMVRKYAATLTGLDLTPIPRAKSPSKL